jgi:hypothetical protein
MPPAVPLRLRFRGAFDAHDGIPLDLMRPGDCCYATHEPGRCWIGWTNCGGRHLYVILPDGSFWDADGRAANCALPGDTTHRCWVMTGDPAAHPPTVSAGKGGHTCAAGAGSIQSPSGWHGYLDGGWLCLQRGQRGPEPAPEEESTLPDASVPAPVPAAAAPAAPPPPTVPHPDAKTEPEHFANLIHVLREHAPAIHGYGHLWHEIASHLQAWRTELVRYVEGEDRPKEEAPPAPNTHGSGAPEPNA